MLPAPGHVDGLDNIAYAGQGRLMKHVAMVCLAGAALALMAPAARAQTDLERFERQLEQIQRDTRLRVDQRVPADQRTLFDYGGYLSLNYLSTDDQNGDNHGLRQYDLVGYAHLNLDGVHEFYASVRGSYRDFNPGDPFEESEGSGWRGQLDRAYYKFDLQRYYAAYKGETINYNVTFEGGRQLVSWANGLTLSELLDGVLLDLEYGPFTLELLAGQTPRRTVDFDSSRPHFDDNTFRGFYGAMLTTRVGQHRPFAYALFQQDYNHSYTSTLGAISTKFDYYSYYLGIGSSGSLTDRLVYGVEAVYEGGSTLSNSFEPTTFFPTTQQKDQISAWAADGKLDYLLGDERHTRFGFEAILASGDTDRLNSSTTFAGNRAGTKDHAFNAFGLLNTGLAFSPSVSNLMAFRVGASTFPFPDSRRLGRLQVGTDFFVFNKMREDGGIDEATQSGRYLGVEPDVYLNWQVTSDVTLVLRYGVFFPNSDVVLNDDARQFFYGGVTFAF
jgi:hypothetical protein